MIKIFMFINNLFANNKDLSFQLKYKIILANEMIKLDKFIINSNLIY